jgi:hypothetical protein
MPRTTLAENRRLVDPHIAEHNVLAFGSGDYRCEDIPIAMHRALERLGLSDARNCPL